MDIIKRMEPVWLALVVVGALNWLLVGLFEWNLVAEIFGTGTVTDVIYVIVGLAGVAMLPRLFEDFRLEHATHAPDRGVASSANGPGVHTRSAALRIPERRVLGQLHARVRTSRSTAGGRPSSSSSSRDRRHLRRGGRLGHPRDPACMDRFGGGRARERRGRSRRTTIARRSSASCQLAALIAGAIAFIRWLHAAYRNVDVVEPSERRYGHGWAIGSWFVPILSLWRPKQIVNDVWRAGSPRIAADASPAALLLVWWLAFVISNFIANGAIRAALDGDTPEQLRSAADRLCGLRRDRRRAERSWPSSWCARRPTGSTAGRPPRRRRRSSRRGLGGT